MGEFPKALASAWKGRHEEAAGKAFDKVRPPD
jgi:hypothetical protein